MKRFPDLCDRSRRRLLLCAGLVLAVTVCAGAADDLDVLLARPMSPGTLALLIGHAKDPRVEKHWRAALSDQSPQVRATAARLLFVNGFASAVPDLARVLADDPDRAVALEAAHALLVMAAGAVDEAVLAAADRFESGELALAVAEARGTAAIGKLERFRALTLEKELEQRLVSALAARGEPALDQVAEVALRASDPDLWLAVLNVAHDESLALASERVISALASSSAAVRAYTWWHVAVLAADGKLPAQLGVGPTITADPGDWLPNVAFGRELAARVISNVRALLPYVLVAAGGTRAYLAIPRFAVRALNPSRGISAETSATADYPRMRTVDHLPEGYVADVLKQTRCKPKDTAELAGAVIRYSARGHLKDLKWVATSLKGACAQAARYIVAAALLPATHSMKPDAPEWVLLPMREQFLQCLAGGFTGRGERRAAKRAGSDGIVPPKKIREVRPVYPDTALTARRQGIVIVEATISPAGCVDRAEITRGVATDFDIEALRAVTAWAFTPTLLDGLAVPVVMTVTVAFTLK